MEDPTKTSPRELVEALMSSRMYWRDLKRRHENIEELVTMIVQAPLFRYTYSKLASPALESMVYDARSGAGLLANNLLSPFEINAFSELGLIHHLNLGMALTARSLRSRVNSIPFERFVQTACLEAFANVLAVVGKDLREPRPIFQEIIDKLSLDESERMSVLHASVANLMDSSHLTVH